MRRAEAGTGGWEDAVRLQRWATPDHADFYALAGEMVATLRALDDLARLLRRQVAGYARTQQDRGRRLYDDTRQVDPAERLQTAVIALEELRSGAVDGRGLGQHVLVGHRAHRHRGGPVTAAQATRTRPMTGRPAGPHQDRRPRAGLRAVPRGRAGARSATATAGLPDGSVPGRRLPAVRGGVLVPAVHRHRHPQRWGRGGGLVTGRGTLYLLLTVVAGAAAMLSFAALRDLALLCGFGPRAGLAAAGGGRRRGRGGVAGVARRAHRGAGASVRPPARARPARPVGRGQRARARPGRVRVAAAVVGGGDPVRDRPRRARRDGAPRRAGRPPRRARVRSLAGHRARRRRTDRVDRPAGGARRGRLPVDVEQPSAGRVLAAGRVGAG